MRHLRDFTLQHYDQCSTLIPAPAYIPLPLFCDPVRYYLMLYVMTERYRRQPYSSTCIHLINLPLSFPSDFPGTALIFLSTTYEEEEGGGGGGVGGGKERRGESG